MTAKNHYDKQGEISIARGTEILKTAFYSCITTRNNLITNWTRDIKNLESTENYYFIIKPKV